MVEVVSGSLPEGTSTITCHRVAGRESSVKIYSVGDKVIFIAPPGEVAEFIPQDARAAAKALATHANHAEAFRRSRPRGTSSR